MESLKGIKCKKCRYFSKETFSACMGCVPPVLVTLYIAYHSGFDKNDVRIFCFTCGLASAWIGWTFMRAHIREYRIRQRLRRILSQTK